MSQTNHQPIRVLFVCLGNICRSPLAEGVFRKLVDEAGLSAHFEIDSAGTGPGTSESRPTGACSGRPGAMVWI